MLAFDAGRVYVIRDGQHDAILAELARRKHAQLLAWYGEIDMRNEPEKEIQKFRWLHKRGALTESEVPAKICLLQVPLLAGEVDTDSGGGRMLN